MLFRMRRMRLGSTASTDDSALEQEQRAAAHALRERLQELRPEVLVADVFDTVLLRAVHPEDVKRLAARRLAIRLDLAEDPEALYLVRNRLERQLCLHAASRGLDEEFRLLELADELYSALAGGATRSFTREHCRQQLLAAELDAEREVQRLDPYVVDVMDEHVAGGGRLILLSDFYLSADVLVELLGDAGFGPTRYERLITSSDTLVTKRSGRLYAQLLAELGLPAQQLLMVGDNAHSDGAMAEAAGMQSLVLDRTLLRARYADLARRTSSPWSLAHELDAALATDPLPSAGPDVFPELALTLAFAMRRLQASVRRAGHPEVLFLAREGLPLQRLFDVAMRLEHPKSPQQAVSRYVFVSRRATFLPSLGPLESEEFISLFRQYRAISVREFLLNLGFDAVRADALAASAGVEAGRVEPDLPTSAAYAALLASPGFAAAYEQRRTEQRALLAEYLAPSGRTALNQLCLVDVGWKGTIQDHLQAALQPIDGVVGYYVGLVASGTTGPDNVKQGLLFDFRAAEGAFYEVFDQNRALFEVVLSAAHGSTAGYAQRADGIVAPVLERVSDSDSFVADVVAPVQARLLARAERILEILARSAVDDREVLRHVARRHARMVYFPKKAELEWFSGLSHDENFGLFRRSTFAREPRGGHDRWKNLVDLLRAPRRVLAGCFWPRQGLDELGLAPLGLLYGAYKARRILVPVRLRR
jgi:FMN phosphatase YigB (HAD superfamily)